ncbi:hypothetical protein [Streptomyces anulatus]|uniref:hypothetical protein n=1 Tax=Streptomyces anulatus TaxID=1892 RepID=UPI0016756596|nr:hypothetical protein [Streptomyces anulatus]GGY73867.1 hypothetical protein GCM10010342_72040 [Streptomyces anulatus]
MDYFRRNVAVDAKAGRGKRRECDGGVTQDAEARQRATITKLKKTIAYKNAELDQLRADVPALVRAVNRLLEPRSCASGFDQPNAKVVPLRARQP